MTKTKTTKKALFASAMSLIICFAMLLGTTYAWFTDSVTSGSNVIQSGKLDIVLEYWDGDSWEDAEGQVLNFKKASTGAGEEVLWEPGCTYELPKIRVRNEGNLNAYVVLRLNGVIGDEKLMEAIDLKNKVENVPESLKTGSQANLSSGYGYAQIEGKSYDLIYGTPDGTVIWDWQLAAKGVITPNSGNTDTSAEFTISGHMKEEAGNEYQDLQIEGVSITALAKQQVYEYDSFGREYDKNAEFDINNAYIGNVKYDSINDAIAAAKDGDTIRLTVGTFYEALDLQGKSLTIQGTGKGATIIAGPKDYTTENIPKQEWAGWSGQDKYVYALISANEDVTIKDLTVKADPTQIGEVGEFRHEGSSAFVGIHVQSANAVIENVDIKGIKPNTVTTNDHHNFGLYITSAIGNDNTYRLTYKNGTVSDVNRGGIYCWGNKYTLNFENVTVIGPGNINNPNGTLTPAAGFESAKEIYAFAPFYLESSAQYKDVVVRDSYRVSWGGANWNGWSANNWATNPPTGATCINSGIAD